jgi:hypothetical protein
MNKKLKQYIGYPCPKLCSGTLKADGKKLKCSKCGKFISNERQLKVEINNFAKGRIAWSEAVEKRLPKIPNKLKRQCISAEELTERKPKKINREPHYGNYPP